MTDTSVSSEPPRTSAPAAPRARSGLTILVAACSMTLGVRLAIELVAATLSIVNRVILPLPLFDILGVRFKIRLSCFHLLFETTRFAPFTFLLAWTFAAAYLGRLAIAISAPRDRTRPSSFPMMARRLALAGFALGLIEMLLVIAALAYRLIRWRDLAGWYWNA